MKEITDTLILFYYKNHISSVVKMNNPVIFLSTEGNCANNYTDFMTRYGVYISENIHNFIMMLEGVVIVVIVW
jgi:hypothetical protein